MRSEGTGTIARVVRLLRCLAEAPGDISITELSKQLGLAPSTIHRVLQLLIDEGIVAKSDSRSLYRPGLELVRIGALISSKTQLGDVALPSMERLVAASQEACMLTQLIPHELKVMVTASIASPHPLRYDIALFQRSSLLFGATGRTILAYLSEEQIDEALRQQRDEQGEAPDRAELLKDLAQIRAQGFALTHGQKVAGAVGIGAPIFDGSKRVVAAVNITLPEQRFAADRSEDLAAMVMGTAAEISGLLGYSG